MKPSPKVKEPIGHYREDVPNTRTDKSWILQTITWLAIATVGAASILALLKEVNVATVFFFLL